MNNCPDCGSNDTVNRCLHCGCQWECTPDPRLKEAIEEIKKEILADEIYPTEQTKVEDKYFEQGLGGALNILYKHIPEVKE